MAIIVCVDDDPTVAVVVEHTLSTLGHRPLVHSSVEDALQAVARTPVDLIIADYGRQTPGGIELIKKLEQRRLLVPVIIMTGPSSVESAVASIESGAIDYVAKPIRPETLGITVNRALEIIRLRRENEVFRAELGKLESTADGSVFNLDELERSAIGRALTATGGNRTRAAKLLGISERTLRNKLNTPKLATPGS
jgi:DNA-binding NtrC family response regulator